MAGRDNPDGISSVGNGTVYNRMCTKWRHEKGSPDTKGFPDKKIEQVMGIEPTYLAWKASVLPLNYTCMKSIYLIIIGVTGFEPATSWSQTRRSSQAEPHPVITVYINISQMILNFKYFYVPSKPHIEFRLFTNLFPLTFWISPRPISISQLHTLLHFHL